MPKIPPDLLPRARQIILPLVSTEDDRETLLTEAFYLHDPLLYGIERDGAAKVFAIRCLKKLLDHGCLSDGEHALARLLKTARYDCGTDKHPEIDTLAATANALCRDTPTSQRPDRVPAPDSPAPTQTIATPRDQRRPTVFISYSHDDTDMAQRLIADLNAAGHACWIDTSDIKGGDEWIMTIAEGINNSYAFVPVVTRRALQSQWVQDEILWARQKKKRIIPVILENVLSETRFFPLVSYQGVTVFDRDYDTALSLLLEYLPNPTLPDVDTTDADDRPDDPTPEPVTVTAAPRAVPRKLELSYLERLRLEELLNTDKYTAMGGMAQVEQKPEMRAVFELLPMGREREAQQETQHFENAVTKIRQIRRCVLLGEPGGGKTTTIWKLAADLVADALDDRTAPLPILIRLGKWTDAKQSLADFIAGELGDLSIYFETLLREKRAALLLDGLNEIPVGQHKAKYPQVQRFIEEHPDALAVVSCRELDYTLDLGFDRITITPLDPIRIREFAVNYLGQEQGEALFWKLAGEDAANYHRRIMDDLVTEEADSEMLDRVFWLETRIPEPLQPTNYKGEKRDPYGWDGWLREREAPSSMMVLARNPYMLLMLTSVYADEGDLPDNRGQLFARFVDILMRREIEAEVMSSDEHEELLAGLMSVAYTMQMRDPDERDDGDAEALTVLPEDEVLEILTERQLYLSGAANILSVGEQIRFTHQLLQEYFAAKYMDVSIFDEDVRIPMKAVDIWPPEHWWERTNWEEAAILLAGLYSDDPTPVVEWLMDAQPEVAAQCITRSGAATPPDDTLLKLRAAWIPRLTDLENDPDPRARAAVGRALGQLTLSNGKPLDNREGVAFIVRGQIRIPDIDWVSIPGGEFIYGDDDKEKYPSFAKPANREEWTLPSFYISRYPVTYAQFQCFVDASDYHDNQWWVGMPEEERGRQIREISEQYFKFWNHPRETVMWYQAVAFTRWLSDKLDVEITLPTEQQYERAARGTDGRAYPYGDEFDASKGNTSETQIGQTSAVGIFLNGVSPEKVSDVSGNVFEWCLNKVENTDDTSVDESGAPRVLRGGSWDHYHYDACAAYRYVNGPCLRSSDGGFRLVCVRAPSL